MAGRKSREIDTEAEEIEELQPGIEAQEDPLEQENVEQIQSILRSNELAGGKVAIRRKRKGDPESEYLYTDLPIADFDLEHLKGVFGGGLYFFDFKTAEGKYVRKNVRWRVSEAFKPQADPSAPLQANGDSKTDKLIAAMTAKQGDPNTILLAFMQMQQQQMQAAQQQQQAQMEAQRQHSAEMMSIVTAALKSTPQPSVVDQLAKLLGAAGPVLDFLKPKGGGAMKDALETIEIAKRIGGGGDGEGSTIGQLLSAAAPFIHAKLAQAAPAATTVTVAPAEAQTAQPTAAAIAEPAFDETNPDMVKALVVRELRELYPQMAKLAAKGVDAGSYYDVLASEIADKPELVKNALVEILKADNWIEIVFARPTIPNQAWFEQFRGYLLEDFGPQPEEAAAEPKAATVPAVVKEPKGGKK